MAHHKSRSEAVLLRLDVEDAIKADVPEPPHSCMASTATAAPIAKEIVSGWERVHISDAALWHSPKAASTLTSKTGNISSCSLAESDVGSEDSSVASDLFIKGAINDSVNFASEYEQQLDLDGPVRYRRAYSVNYGNKNDVPFRSINYDSLTQDLAQFAMRRDGKLLIAMVGLPATGKTYIAKRIKRHLQWLGVHTELFNAGNYRRQVCGGNASAALFDPANPAGAEMRRKCAEAALTDALASLYGDDTAVAIFDATNSTKSRRAWLRDTVAAHRQRKEDDKGGTAHTQEQQQQQQHVQLVFLESVCDNDATVWNNVKEAKLHSPDYEGWEPQAAMNDFLQRIQQYKSVYETLSESEGMPFIKLENTGEKLVVYRAKGYAVGRITQLLGHTQLSLRGIILTRPGESVSSSLGKLGGISGLTAAGSLYANRFAQVLPDVLSSSSPLRAEEAASSSCSSTDSYGTATADAVAAGIDSLVIDAAAGSAAGIADTAVWAAASPAASEFVQPLANMGVEVLQLAALNDIAYGSMDGMTYIEFAKKYPIEYHSRASNKLHYRFPNGESYADVFRRLEPVLLELLGEKTRVIICAHLPVLRIIYGYLMDKAPAECCTLDIPLNCAISLTPKGYGYSETRYYPLSAGRS